MRIKEFHIVSYGPLIPMGRVLPGDFTLFYGRNEEGKTLLIDALVKILLGRKARDFHRMINRVEESPLGYVIVEREDGEYKLPDKGDLTRISDLTPGECRNIFIIRDSDLRIEAEANFYTRLTDRLTGLRTEELSRIKGKLLEIGRLTPHGEFLDVKEEKLKSRMGKARELLGVIDSLLEEAEREELDRLEEETEVLRERIGGLEEEIKALEESRKREKYWKGRESLERLKRALEKAGELRIFNEEEERLWRDSDRKIQEYTKDKEKLDRELEEKEGEAKEIGKAIKEKEEDFRILQERKRKIEEEIEPEIKSYLEKKEELAREEEKRGFFLPLRNLSAVFLILSLSGVILRPSLFFYLFSLLSGATLLLSFSSIFLLVRKRTHLVGLQERIKLVASSFGLEGEEVPVIAHSVQKFEEEFQKESDNLEEMKREKELLIREAKRIREDRITELEERIREAEDRKEGIRRKSKVESLPQYTQKLKERWEEEESIRRERNILKNLLEVRGEDLKENISFWEETLGELEEFKNRAEGVKYSERAIAKKERERENLVRIGEEKEEKMSYFRRRLGEVGRVANEILRGEFLPCETSVDLKGVKEKLEEFLAEKESNRACALEVLRLFQEIEKEEREKVASLFGEKSPASRYFREITGGIYRKVTFSQEKGTIEVEKGEGTILEAEKLSGGAYDQLYFSLRLALGEKLLKERRGFFIMDDPFVKADPQRLKRQLEMLKKISSGGWQVLYFSAKGEIREALEEDIRAGRVRYIEIQGLKRKF